MDDLERQVNKLLDQYRSVKNERDELAERVSRLEAEVAELRSENQDLKGELAEVRKSAPDPKKEERIKTKVDELLSKLEGI